MTAAGHEKCRGGYHFPSGFCLDYPYHSRLDEEHYRNCQSCYDAHLDFMEEITIDNIMGEYGE
jgi:hypothetical protein